jgi:hypothetical protein
MKPGQAIRFAELWIVAGNRHDLDRFLAHDAEDVEMTSPATSAVAGGAGVPNRLAKRGCGHRRGPALRTNPASIASRA